MVVALEQKAKVASIQPQLKQQMSFLQRAVQLKSKLCASLEEGLLV